jgi:1,2-diacylglycerol 3-alpha-glucosyltransferase
MRILIAAETFYPHVNGASYFAQWLSATLKQRGHSVLVIAPSDSFRTKKTVLNGVDVLGIRSISTPFYRYYRICPPFFIQKTIQRAVREFKPDIVHIQNHYFVCEAVAKEAQALGIPVVGTNHMNDPEKLDYLLPIPQAMKRILERSYWKRFNRVFGSLNAVTAPTRSAGDDLKKYGFEKEVLAISCGVDLSLFSSTSPSKMPAFPGLRADKPILLSVGRLEEEKHVDWVLRALPAALKKADFQLLVVGIGNLEPELRELARKLGIQDSVVFGGFIPNHQLPGIYRNSHAFVIAGTAETQSIVVLEAMACGLPIIAVRALALPELCQDGVNGFLFEPEAIDQLSDRIARLMSDPALRIVMSKKSLELVQPHDSRNVILQFEELYTKFIKK